MTPVVGETITYNLCRMLSTVYRVWDVLGAVWARVAWWVALLHPRARDAFWVVVSNDLEEDSLGGYYTPCDWINSCRDQYPIWDSSTYNISVMRRMPYHTESSLHKMTNSKRSRSTVFDPRGQSSPPEAADSPHYVVLVACEGDRMIHIYKLSDLWDCLHNIPMMKPYYFSVCPSRETAVALEHRLRDRIMHGQYISGLLSAPLPNGPHSLHDWIDQSNIQVPSKPSVKTEPPSCGLCLGDYTDPLLLKCRHVFCEMCLYNLESNSHCPPCPKCQSEIIVMGRLLL
jgi:hypothetical protein